MTAKRHQLAAEYALGLLEGPDLAEGRRAWTADTDFRRLAEQWMWQLAPLLEEVEEAPVPHRLWARVDRIIGERARIRALESQVQWSRRANGGLFAAAAALAGILIFQSQLVQPPPPSSSIRLMPAAASAPMVAMLGDAKGTKIVANWDPGGRRLVLAIAGDMPPDPTHAHELWVIPAGAKPISLGTMGSKPMSHMDLANALASLLQKGVTIAITLEPPGGSPSSAPTGPIVASGTLESV